MREKIECGVLTLPMFDSWIDRFLGEAQKESDRLKFFKVDILNFAIGDSFNIGGQSFPNPTVINDLAVFFERYDCLIIPVVQESLVWTRIMLSQLQQVPQIPFVVLAHHIQPVAFLDLVGLGVSDFLLDNDNIALAHVRLRNQVYRYNQQRIYSPYNIASSSVQDFSKMQITQGKSIKALSRYAMTKKRKSILAMLTVEQSVQYQDSFREAKMKVVEDFEKRYIAYSLAQSKGNICAAAQFANKNRRAFWELMRKHNIKAEDFKGEDW
ncbi:hypothetical protein F9B74_05075 [Pelistega sp. NLN82]|uniref:Regulatory Fis family protein n=1 Tax=Pelistega ratti TaxID=2652177 RepID=A0A6L9Y7E9_9BURK|nr:hypothetical protein [Pelistega ratti]NEN75698.1 hypothetical protein [Pelistega ratti]